MTTKTQLESLLLDANNRIIALQQQVPKPPVKDYLYPAYHASAAVLEDDAGWIGWNVRSYLMKLWIMQAGHDSPIRSRDT
jgi:hypothetical protein